MQNIIMYAVLGAICLLIVTGGIVSMTNDSDPSTLTLASGAAVGGGIGAALAYMGVGPPDNSIADMKVGLPSF